MLIQMATAIALVSSTPTFKSFHCLSISLYTLHEWIFNIITNSKQFYMQTILKN